MLKRRAENGVKIYVILYKEVSCAVFYAACAGTGFADGFVQIERTLTINSTHSQHALRDLCPKGSPGHGNIQCMRHPDHNVFENAGDMTFYWVYCQQK